MKRKRSYHVVLWLVLGYAFLYIPICSLVVYSFNKSRLVTVWGGFSFDWYVSLFRNEQMLGALFLSIRVAVYSATIAVVLGTLAGFVIVRFRRFRGRMLFSGLVTAPLVMPEIITGLSLLLLFVAMENMLGWPAGRGMTTITIAHATFSMAFVAVIVQSRLMDMGLDVEEAALDLGARPVTVFFAVTLPIIAPALISGWLLAFTLSLDDLVVASFVSGPTATTLPMVVFSKVRLGLSPEVNALATIIVAMVGLGVGAAGLIMMRQERRRVRDVQMAVSANR